MTADPSKYPNGYFKEKPCKECGKLFLPKAPSHMFCSQECSDCGHTRNYMRKNYNISLEEYYKLLEEQDHKCAICGSVGFKICEHTKLNLVVDHDHMTGRIRGMLCHNCNRALGLLKDNTETLKTAISYLERATTIENTPI